MNRPSHFRQPIPTVQRGDIASQYRSRDTDPLAKALGDMYHPPTVFEHGRETLVARIKATNDDGREVRLFETRAPAAFYALESAGWRATTGSGEGMAKFIVALALEFAAGRIDFEAFVEEIAEKVHAEVSAVKGEG